jgi:hypothetical protein
MSGSQTFQRLTFHALEEHGTIHFFLDQLASTLKSLDTGHPDVEPMRRLAAQIEGLIERLKEHFASEESGGLFQAVQDLLPDETVHIRRLTDQHARMLEILEMAKIHAQRGGAQDAGPLRDDLEGFLRVMRAHEDDETTLLRRALERDNPAGVR